MGNFTPNQEQVKSILQVLLGTGGPAASLFLSYGVTPDRLTLWTNMVLAVVPPLVAAGWALWDNKHKNTIAAAAAIPGVQEIEISTTATDGAKAAAADPTLRNVTKGS
jgi:hypothetical protein